MVRVIVVSLLMMGLLAGCAGTPPQPTATLNTPSGGAIAFRSSPANQMAERIHDFKPPSTALIADALMVEHDYWSGTPYRLGGDSTLGVDCSALVQQVFNKAFAVDLPRTTKGQALEGRRVERSELKPGDLVFFRPPGTYRHVGIYMGSGHFLHASTSQGVIISELDNVFWKQHFWQARRALERTELAQRAVRRVNEG